MPVCGAVMIGVRTYLALGLATAAVTAVGYIFVLNSEKAALLAQIAGYERSIAALNHQKQQSDLARRVEAARAQRFAARADELNASIEAILTGDIPDADLDPAIAAYINGLRGRAD